MLVDPAIYKLFMLGVHYPIQILVVLTAVAMACRLPVKNGWAWTVAVAAVLACVTDFLLDRPGVTDFQVFWEAGCDIWAGETPYARVGCLNPPNAFVVYAPLGLLPFGAAWLIWAILNGVGCIALASAAYRALRGSNAMEALPAPVLAVLTGVMTMSVSCRYGIDVGQVSMLVTMAVLLAVWAWTRQRPWLTGLGLALACVKPATALPFFLLISRWRWRWAWVSVALVGLACCFLVNPPESFFARLQECARNIQAAHQPGARDDYVIPIADSMITLERVFYFSGITDRGTVKWLQLLTLALLGAWTAWRVLGPRPWSAPAACSMIAFLASIFLYHRIYDLLILVIPLTYAMVRARNEAGGARWLYVAVLAAAIGALFMRVEIVKELNRQAMTALPPPQLLQAIIIPHVMWLVLLGMAFLAAAEHWRRDAAAAERPQVTYLRTDLASAERWRVLEEAERGSGVPAPPAEPTFPWPRSGTHAGR